MPQQVNLTNASGQELRQLLDSSRRRGDAALSYSILQEMAARREAPAERRAFKGRRPAEPRVIAVEFGDPLDKSEDLPPMPNWRPPNLKASTEAQAETEVEAAPQPQSALAAASPSPRRSRRAPRPDRALAMAAAAQATFVEEEDLPPPPTVKAERPLSLREADLEPIEEEEAADYGPLPRSGFQPIELGVPKKPAHSRGRLVVGGILGVILGIAVGWLGGWLARDGMSRLSGPAPVKVAAAATPAPPPVAPPAAETPPATDTALGPGGEAQPDANATAAQSVASAPTQPAPAQPAPKAADTAPVPDGTAMELPAPGTEDTDADVAKTAKADKTAKGCAGQPTPADRTICGDARLRHLQAELRRAYSVALAAHEDRALLREHQLAWRDTRSSVSDPDRLARLYEERIRKLNAAAEAAEAHHGH